MPSPTTPGTPDKDQVRLRVVDAKVDLTRWTKYDFSSNYLVDADGWSLTVAHDKLEPAQKDALQIGAKVKLFVNEFPLGAGYIDRLRISADRRGGVQYDIVGRDSMGPVTDAIADPRVQFKPGTTLSEFLKTLLTPFGWSSDSQFVVDARANRDAKTGGVRGTPTSKAKKHSALKDFVLHQLKPHNHEGLGRFIKRTCDRFGLFVRLSADGEYVILAAPDFTQPPRYQLRRNNGTNSEGETNIEQGEVIYDGTDQPSVIVADGFSGGGEFGKGQVKVYCINPYFGMDAQGFPTDDVAKIVASYPEAQPVLFTTQPFTRRAAKMPPKPVFIHDEESKTLEQLSFFVKRTMSELLRRSLVCNYTVEGHGQIVEGVFTPWDIDTVVDVQDEPGMVSERMWILGRRFEKSRSGGTYTHLELVRLYSIASGDQTETMASAGTTDNTKRPRREHESLVISTDVHKFK